MKKIEYWDKECPNCKEKICSDSDVGELFYCGHCGTKLILKEHLIKTIDLHKYDNMTFEELQDECKKRGLL